MSDWLGFALIAAVAVGVIVIFSRGGRWVRIAVVAALAALAVLGLVLAYVALSTWRQ